MEELSTIGDIAKQVFHAHGVDASGATVFSGRITRAKLIGFLREKGTLFVRRAGDEFRRPAGSPHAPKESGSENPVHNCS